MLPYANASPATSRGLNLRVDSTFRRRPRNVVLATNDKLMLLVGSSSK